jgi:thiol-disulfide isomerase/thioredoxin
LTARLKQQANTQAQWDPVMNSWKTSSALAVVVGMTGFVLLLSGCKPSGEGAPEQPPSEKGNQSKGLIGNKAPDFHGDFAVNGKPIKLSDLQGKVVLLDFWGVWCPPCVGSLPHLIELNAKYKSRGLEVIGFLDYNYEKSQHYEFDAKKGKLIPIEHFTKQSQEAMIRNFVEYHRVDYLVMTLPDELWAKVFRAYNIGGFPTVFLIDRAGNVRKSFGGASDSISRSIDMEVNKLLNE